MEKGYGIKCPREYIGKWKNDKITLEIGYTDCVIHKGKKELKIRGKMLKEYYDYGYSVSIQVAKEVFYFSVVKAVKAQNVLLFKLSTIEKGRSRVLFEETLRYSK